MDEPVCELCERKVPSLDYIERHHLIPKQRKGPTINVCIDCAPQIHKIFTIKELNEKFNSLEALKSDLRTQKWINWISNKNRFGMCRKNKKRKLR